MQRRFDCPVCQTLKWMAEEANRRPRQGVWTLRSCLMPPASRCFSRPPSCQIPRVRLSCARRPSSCLQGAPITLVYCLGEGFRTKSDGFALFSHWGMYRRFSLTAPPGQTVIYSEQSGVGMFIQPLRFTVGFKKSIERTGDH
jgi:hypothetical protein